MDGIQGAGSLIPVAFAWRLSDNPNAQDAGGKLRLHEISRYAASLARLICRFSEGRHLSIVMLLCLLPVLFLACARQESGSTSTAAATSKVLVIGDLTWQEIDALNRERTLFLVTVGMLEEHGPHLPIAADTIGVEHEAARVADRLSQQLLDWNVVLMPTINYGSSGANQIGNVAIHPGTYGIRQPSVFDSRYWRANRPEWFQVGPRHEWSWGPDRPYRDQRSV
jgi:Creatinine amidohydrolase